ncbi:MAG: HEAT repeat domain-containing protein, partial [Candidatus Omnitrophota bacterium]
QKEEQALPTAAGITQEMAIEFTTKAIVEKKWSKLAELGQHAAPALLKALNDPVAFFRQKAAETLQVVRHPLTIAPLWERLFIEKSNDVSYAIAQAILAMGGENAEKELKKFIEEHPDPAIWKVTTLYLMGETKKASTMIKKLLEENDQEIIQKFLEDRLEKGFPKEEKEPLKKLIDMGVTIHFDILADQGSSKTARIDALRFLGKYGAEKQVDGLVTASKSNDMEIVKEAGTALASINERQVRKKIPTYLEVLADPGASSRARVEAADFLGEYGGPAERKALVNAAGGMDFKVTKAITMAISKIDKRHGGKKKGSHGFAFLPFAIPQNFSELIEIIKESPVWCGAIALGALAVFAGLILFLRFVYHRLRPVVWNLKRIGSKNPAKRKAAAAALGELAPFKEKEIEEVISALEETTRDKVSAVRMAAAEAIGKIGKEAENAIPDLVRLVIEDEDPQVRITAAKSLGETGLMGIFALAEKLKDEDAAVRLSAAKAFGNVDPKTPKIEHIFVNLEGTLEDPDKDVRDAGMNAFSSLDALTPERKVKRYIADLGDGQHVGVRDEAMRQLDELDAVTIGLRVKKYMFDLEDDNAEVRKSGAEKLGKLGVYARGLGRKIRGTDEEFREMLNELKKAAPILVQMLQKDEGAGIRAAAAAALGDIGPVTFEVVPALVKAVKDPEAKVRESAILALCKFPAATPNMTNAIIGAAGDKNEGVRAAAARFFGGVKPASDRVISVLVKLSGDPDENVRRDARTVLEKLEKPQAAVPSLIEIAKDEEKDLDTRVAAILGLGEITPVTTEAINNLVSFIRAAAGREAVHQKATDRELAGRNIIVGRSSTHETAVLSKSEEEKTHREEFIAGEEFDGKDEFHREVVEKSQTREHDSRRIAYEEAAAREAYLRESETRETSLRKSAEREAAIRETAVEALVKIGPSAKPIFMQLLADDEEYVREAGAHAIAKISPDAVQELISIICATDTDTKSKNFGRDYYFRRYAAKELVKIGPEAVFALMENLESRDPRSRKAVESALGIIGEEPVIEAAVHVFAAKGPEVIPVLVNLAKSEHYHIRLFMARAIRKVGPEAISALAEELNSGKDSDLSHAADALGEVGPDAALAADRLEKLLENEMW